MSILQFAFSFQKKIRADHVTAFSGYATLYILVSLIPFLMFFLTLLQFTTLTPDIVLDFVGSYIPRQFVQGIEGPVRELFDQSTGTLLSASLITAAWSSSKGVYGIMRGLNAVYGTEENRGYILTRLLSIVYTVFFVILLITTLILMVFGNRIQLLICQRFPFLGPVTELILNLRVVIMAILLTAVFLLMYRFFPNQKGKLRMQLPGAILASAAWMIFSFGFSLYIDWVADVSVTYGSLTTATLLVLWLNVCNTIILTGGAFNNWLETKHITLSSARNS